MIHRFDLWLGKRLFIPIAIRLCQLLRMSQYALHTYIWLAVFFYNLSLGPQQFGWFWYTLMALMMLVWVLIAGLAPESIRQSFTPIRFMFVALFLMDFPLLVMMIANHEPHLVQRAVQSFKDWTIVLAEYALCITHVPPLEKKAKKESAKLVGQEA